MSLPAIDELLGVRTYRAYGCKKCRVLHVQGLDRLFGRHKIFRSATVIERFPSTEVADWREGLQRELAEADERRPRLRGRVMASGAGLRAGEPGDLEACLELLRRLEWALYDSCPCCGNAHPKHADRWHARFRHADDCELARLTRSPLCGRVFSCDCYADEGSGCSGPPTYGGRRFANRIV